LIQKPENGRGRLEKPLLFPDFWRGKPKFLPPFPEEERSDLRLKIPTPILGMPFPYIPEIFKRLISLPRMNLDDLSRFFLSS